MRERLRRLAMTLPGRAPTRNSWSVCSTVAEPPELLYAFVAHYLELGAEEVHLFIDDPDQLGLDILRGMDAVRLTICTDDYWKKRVGNRPPGQVMRQLRNANLAYEQCRTEWFFFCDADEYLLSEKAISDLLASVPAEVAHCRTRMAERAFPAERAQNSLFDGVLRLPLPDGDAMLRSVYGDLAKLTTRGLLGHVIGKSFVRAGRADQRIRIHYPVPYDEAEEIRLRKAGKLRPGPELADTWLVHFDGMTPLHWKLKLLRYYLTYAPKLEAGDTKVFSRRTPARSEQLNAIYQAQGNPAELERLTRLIRPDTDMLAKLKQAGGLLERVVDPAHAARTRIMDDLNFAPRDFDAQLHRRHGALITQYRLEG